MGKEAYSLKRVIYNSLLRMKKYFIAILAIVVFWPSASLAYFYRDNSSDTSFTSGSGKDAYGQTKAGVGYNLKPLADYGYVDGEQYPEVGEVNGLEKSAATLNWRTNFISRTEINYGTTPAMGKTVAVSWQQGEQKYTLKNLQCGTKYYYQITTWDAAGNSFASPAQELLTLSCQVNLLSDEGFDSETLTGKLELTPELSGKTVLSVGYGHKYEIGFSEGAVSKHATFSIVEATKNYPQQPSIASGLFALYEQPALLTMTEMVSGEAIGNLQQSATLQISYVRTRLNGFDPKSLKIAYYDTASGRWLVLPSEIDETNQLVRANIWRLGYYRVVASPLGWISQDLADNKLYREQGTGDLYFVDQGIKHLVTDPACLYSWNLKPEQAESTDSLYRLPQGENLNYRDGSLLQIGAATFYYLEQGGKRLVMNKQIFDEIGWQTSWAYPATKEILAGYFDLAAITDSTTKPDNVLIKYENNPKVYLIEDGKKRWIVNEQAFLANHFRWDRIITVPIYEVYPDGAIVE